jgi:hypothetical protein
MLFHEISLQFLYLSSQHENNNPPNSPTSPAFGFVRQHIYGITDIFGFLQNPFP